MAHSMASTAVRTQPKSIRTGLDSITAKDAKIRMDSEPLRIDPMLLDKAATLALIDEARIKCGMSGKEMAHYAGVLESVLSEALSGTRGNFAAHWLFLQPEKFVTAFTDLVLLKRGIDKPRLAQIRASRIGELVALLVEQTVVSE